MKLPQRIPSGTPIRRRAQKKPQKMTLEAVPQALVQPRARSGWSGGVREARCTSARATSCGAGRKIGFAGSPIAGIAPSARAFAFASANAWRSYALPLAEVIVPPGSP